MLALMPQKSLQITCNISYKNGSLVAHGASSFKIEGTSMDFIVIGRYVSCYATEINFLTALNV